MPVSADEQDVLRSPDERRVRRANVLTTKNAEGLRRAVVSFVAAVCIRQWQQRDAGERPTKYAMVVHNDTQRAAHEWQGRVVQWITEAVTEAADGEDADLRRLFDLAYADLRLSIEAHGGRMPDPDSTFENFVEAFQGEEVAVEIVNSDADLMALLDDKAELRLRTAFNIFIGGNILDRGITVPNLIAFYYGRNPQTTQADTVLQHSRMYGNRPRADVAVTRLYTSPVVYDRMYRINSFDNALREAFEEGEPGHGVVFIRTDETGRIKPCAPDKLLLSDVVSVRAGKMYLPSRFQTAGARKLDQVGQALEALLPDRAARKTETTITRDRALDILDVLEEGLDVPASAFDWSAMQALLTFYADRVEDC